MQFIVTLGEGGAVEIKCPICDSVFGTNREQDWRVHIMLHPVAECPWSKKLFRIDRLSGYGEPWPDEPRPEVKEESSCSSEETRTSTSTREKIPCTISRSVTRHTPRDTRAVAPGRIRR